MLDPMLIAKAAADAAERSAAASVVSSGTAVVALLVSIGAGLLLWEQLKSARWLALLSFEQSMHDRAQAFTTIAQQLAGGSAPAGTQAIYDAAKEAYFNSVDRLASSILNGQFPEKEMRQDYRDYIQNIVRAHPSDFNTGTSYRKVVRLHQKWQDQ